VRDGALVFCYRRPPMDPMPVPTAPAGGDPLAPLRSRSFLDELRRKAIHLSTLVLPLDLLFEVLPWPRGRGAWTVLLLVLVAGAIALDLLRIHENRVRRLFHGFFHGMIREHEEFGLMGSTYLLLAALLAVDLFPRPLAAAALGFTVLGDAFAAIVGKAFGRIHIFRKSLEGALGGLVACLAWAAFLAVVAHLPWHVVVVGALTASLAELLPIPLDDNLAITLFAGYAMRLLWSPL
jgi:glycerol-3-phosphate acyltransferase PlsY